jgi:hypothetical protein
MRNSWDRAVSPVTTLQASGPKNTGSNLGNVIIFPPCKASSVALESAQPPIQYLIATISPASERSGREAENSLQSSDEIKNEYINNRIYFHGLVRTICIYFLWTLNTVLPTYERKPCRAKVFVLLVTHKAHKNTSDHHSYIFMLFGVSVRYV